MMNRIESGIPHFLRTPQDVVRLSFLVQRSLCHLDLSLCEYSRKIKVINTEEAYLKAVDKGRKERYALNLDVAAALNKRVVVEANPILDFYSNDDPVIKLRISLAVYKDQLGYELAKAIEKSSEKLKLLRSYLKAKKLLNTTEIFHFQEETDVFESFMTFLLEECDDSSLIVDLLRVSELCMSIILRRENTRELEFVIFHSQKMKFRLFKELKECPFKFSLREGKYKNLKILAKYGYTPQIRISECDLINRENMGQEFLHLLSKPVGPYVAEIRREIFLMIVYKLYLHNFWHPEAVAQAIRLYFRSIPDCFLSKGEIIEVIDWTNPYLSFSQVWKFYKNAFSNDRHFCTRQPRVLTHYCRCTIRKALNANYALPEGIDRIGNVPPILKSYLRLED